MSGEKTENDAADESEPDIPAMTIGRQMAIEDMAIIMMGIFLTDEQRDRLRPVLEEMLRAPPKAGSEGEDEIRDRYELGRAIVLQRMLRILDARVEQDEESDKQG